MKRRRCCRKCQTAQSSPADTLTREAEAEAADHLQAAKMVEREEVKEHDVPDQSSEANKSIHAGACRSEEEQITLELLHGERRWGGAKVGAEDCNVYATHIYTCTHILYTHTHL